MTMSILFLLTRARPLTSILSPKARGSLNERAIRRGNND